MLEQTKISNTEVVMIIVGIVLGERLISLPAIVVRGAGYGALLSVFFGGVLAIGIVYIIARLSLNFPNKTVLEYSSEILGKVTGRIITVLLFLYFLAFLSHFLRRIGEIIKETFLFATPIEVIMMILIVASGYCVIGGIVTYSKVTDSLLAIAFVAFVVLIISSLPFASYGEVLPAFQIEGLKMIRPISPGLTSFIGIEIVPFLIPFMKSPDKIKRNSITALIIVTILFTINVFLPMAILTKESLMYKIYPLFEIAKIIALPGAFDIRADIIFAGFWLLLAYLVITGYHYLASLSLTRTIGSKSQGVFAFIIIPIVYVLSLLPQNFGELAQTLDLLEKIWLYGILGIFILIYIFGIVTKKIKA